DLAQQAETLLGQFGLPGGAEVEEDHIGLDTAQEDQGLFGGLGRGDVQIGEDLLEILPQAAIILKNEKLAALHLCRRQQLLCHSCSRFPRGSTKKQNFTLSCKEIR